MASVPVALPPGLLTPSSPPDQPPPANPASPSPGAAPRRLLPPCYAVVRFFSVGGHFLPPESPYSFGFLATSLRAGIAWPPDGVGVDHRSLDVALDQLALRCRHQGSSQERHTGEVKKKHGQGLTRHRSRLPRH